jgi:hypothetical protein
MDAPRVRASAFRCVAQIHLVLHESLATHASPGDRVNSRRHTVAATHKCAVTGLPKTAHLTPANVAMIVAAHRAANQTEDSAVARDGIPRTALSPA